MGRGPLFLGCGTLLSPPRAPPNRLTEESRRLFGELGSAVAKDLAFRDSWVFLGAKGVQDKSPFEQVGLGGHLGGRGGHLGGRNFFWGGPHR